MVRDVHRRERLFEQRDLADELGRRLAAGALVLGVLAGAEGVARDVERDREVGRLLVLLQQVEQHRDEAVDGVRVLPVAGHETVDRQGVERPERERVAVDDQEGRLFRVRHGAQPTERPPTPHRPRWSANDDPTPTDLDPELVARVGDSGGGALADKMGIEFLELVGGALGRADARRGQPPGRRPAARRRPRRARRIARLDLRRPSTPAPDASPSASRSTPRTAARSPRAGSRAPAPPLVLGRTLATHEIVMTDEQGRRLSTVRMTNFLRDAG